MKSPKVVYEVISSKNTREFVDFYDALKYFHNLKKLGLGVLFNARRVQDKSTNSVFILNS